MNDHELDALLRSANGEFPMASGFQRGVWSRIEAEAAMPTVLQGFWAWTARPLGIITGVAAMAALGLFLGAATVPDAVDARLSYVESISPFIHRDR
jgi:hypothetical protein